MEYKKKLASLLVNYSIELKPNEKVLIEAFDVPDDFVSLVVDEVFAQGGFPFVLRHNWLVDKRLLLGTTKDFALARKSISLNL